MAGRRLRCGETDHAPAIEVKPQRIFLQRGAPDKPPLGAPCNGCGVCCASATCPVARVFLLQWRGPCRALEWHAGEARYLCGMLRRPAQYVRLLPHAATPAFARIVRRYIAAGIGCDAPVEAAPPASTTSGRRT